jgi:hypothetical protein
MTDLYVFAREADPGLVGEKQSIGVDQALRFVAATTGAFQALAVVEMEDLAATPTYLQETFGNPGGKSLETAVPIKVGPMQIRWTKQYDYIAFSRIRAEPGRALDVLGSTAVVDGYNGSAIVAGAFDVLVEFGADEFEDLQETLLNGLHAVQGVWWSETAIVTDYFYRGPRDSSAA